MPASAARRLRRAQAQQVASNSNAGTTGTTSQPANRSANAGSSGQSAGMPAPASLGVPREWVALPELSPDGASVVTVMSYNVLAQVYVRRETFPLTERRLLRQRARLKAVDEELRALVDQHSLDVLCLQELEAEEVNHMLSLLEEFHGIYKQRTSAGSRMKRDGCGIFWRHKRFEPVQEGVGVELNEIGTDPLCQQTLEDSADAMRDCVAAITCLRELATGMRFVVANAHLFWDPAFANVKIAQAYYVRREVLAFAEGIGVENIVLAGDWNSTPDSPVFSLLDTGRVDPSHAGLPGRVSRDVVEEMNRGCEAEEASEGAAARQLRSAIKLSSSSDDAAQSNVDAPLTTLTFDFRGVLDHVFVSRGRDVGDGANTVLGHLALPTATQCMAAGVRAFPAAGHPSDHLPVVVRLALTHGDNG